MSYAASLEQDKELQAIFERTYGKVERGAFRPQPKPARTSLDDRKYSIQAQKKGPEYLLADGYNLIFAWEELKAVARDNLDAARQMLMEVLSNYQGFKQNIVILVFDAYRVPRSVQDVTKYHNIYVVYTMRLSRDTWLLEGPGGTTGCGWPTDGGRAAHHPGPRGPAAVGLRLQDRGRAGSRPDLRHSGGQQPFRPPPSVGRPWRGPWPDRRDKP